MLPYCTANGSLSFSPDGSDEGIPEDKQFARRVGSIYVAIGLVSIPISSFVLSVFIRPSLIHHSCYKIMALTTALDIFNVLYSAVIPGFFSILDIHHCKDGLWVSYVIGPSMFFWMMYCCTSEVLALNRMLEFANRSWAQFLFEGKRVYFWFALALSYAMVGGVLLPGKFYFYNTYGGYIAVKTLSGEVRFRDTTYQGTRFFPSHNGSMLEGNTPHIIQIFNNFFKFVFITISYSLMLIFMYRRLRTHTIASTLKFQVRVSIQTLTIAVLADAATLAYLVIGYVPLSPAVGAYAGMVVELSWISLHGGTGIIYMIMNRAVKQRLKEVFCGCARIAPNDYTENTREGTATH
uniref:G protein-coupled receptor n=1 Tax=Steinernema glaseri TaxID=37863 RepID=A0A1I8ALA9_9BILA